MRIREHKDFGHVLKPGTDHDANCNACKAERALGITPVITEPQTRTAKRAAQRQAFTDLDWPEGKTFGELTPEQKRAAVERAADRYQQELNVTGPAISRILDDFEAGEGGSSDG